MRQLVHGLGLSPLAATLLVNRGIEGVAEAGRFLELRLRDMPSPFLMKGMAPAVERIVAAFREDEPIVVWGDYDVDGVTSVSLLMSFFRALGVPARYVIPDRFQDGYGLNLRQLEEIAAEGARLLITVDCGGSAVSEIARARQLGLDVIVVDHHQLPPELPAALAIINPLQQGCDFPFSGMAACGLTFFLLMALRKALRDRGVFERMPEPDLRGYLDLVGLGTIADMVPLVDQNRLLAYRGIEELQRSERPGIVALREVANLAGQPLDSNSVGFELGPRLNAVGRLGSARRAVDLLLAPDLESARAMAAVVDRENRRRREVQKETYEDAVCCVEDDGAVREAPAIVLAREGWHPGVLGIVASKLVDRYQRPVLLVALNEGLGRGSGRSVPGLDLFEALSACAPWLEAFGGHSLAGGLTIREERVESFREAFAGVVGERLGACTFSPEIVIDGPLALNHVDRELLAEVERLGPYGSGYRAPIFLAQAVQVSQVRVVGRDHLQMELRDGGRTLPAIAFGGAHHRPERGCVVDVVYRPEMELYRGRQTLRLRVEDLRHHPG